MGSISKIPEGTHTVVIGFGDLNGIMRGKRIPSNNWENVCKNGTAICLSALVYDMTCDVWDTPVANNDNGYPDTEDELMQMRLEALKPKDKTN